MLIGRHSLFFVSFEALLALLFDTPVFFALGLEAEAFLAWLVVEFSVVGDVAVEGFEVDLVLFEGFDLAVYFSFCVV